MRHFLPLLLIGLGGCSLPALGTSLDDYADARYGGVPGYYQGYGEPLRATVWFDEYTGYASFDLNRSAHVAVFALQPMGGLQMIYPAIGYGARQLFSAGSHVVNTWSSRYQYAGARSMYGGTMPTYILLIASDRPLDVGSFMATGSMPWLSRLSITYNPYVATEALAREIVPDPDRTDWTVAYHVIWPRGMGVDPYHRYNRRPYTWIVCPGNVMLSVPVEAVRNGWVYCPDGNLPDRRRNPNLPRIADALPQRPPPTGWMGPRDRPAGTRGETLERLGQRPTPPGRTAGDSTDVRVPWRRPVTEIDLGVVEGRPRIDLDRPQADPERPVRQATPARPAAEPSRATPSRPEARRPEARPSERATPSRPETTSPRTVPTRAVPTRPAATPARGTPAKPEARPSRPTPAPAKATPARPATRSRPTAGSRPTTGSRPAAKPASRPASRPAPKAPSRPKKPKGGGGGGG